MVIASWIFWRSKPARVDRLFRKLQLVSAGLYSLGHGANDAQKTMGIIVALLVAAGHSEWTENSMHVFGRKHDIALWIILSCQTAMALGTLSGGWRIVKTMGSRITHLQPFGGFCAETAGASTLIGTALLGIPISTTHAITGAIMGVGSAKNFRSVRWIWAERIVGAWVLTLPLSAAMGAVIYWFIHHMIEPCFR
jgi:PiT family inorganic phosphate transporter